MKRFVSLLLVFVTALSFASAAAPASPSDMDVPCREAPDITSSCGFETNCYRKRLPEEACDRRYTTCWDIDGVRDPHIAFTSPEGEKIHYLYLCFGKMPEKYEVQVMQDGQWVKYCDGDMRFHHVTYEFPDDTDSVRIFVPEPKEVRILINELFIFGEGKLPDFVQRWQPTLEKADIMFIATHPDDELIFLGGSIPTYAVEKKAKTVVVYFTHSGNVRRSELLNGLWSMGVRNYPVIGEFHDHYPAAGEDVYATSGGKERILKWFTSLIRQYKPEVVVTQDIHGEYGHEQHRLVSRVTGECIGYACDETQYPESAEKYGTWQVKKFYRHLHPENQIKMDWNVPLISSGGKTALELADAAFQFHRTQLNGKWSVTETGKKYDNSLFGLVSSTVGPDIIKNDFLENISTYVVEDEEE